MTDEILILWMSSLIEAAKVRWVLGGGDPWTPGKRLRLLFAGYNGTRNTGSDVRVEEMLRQVRRVLGEERVELTVMSQNSALTHGYFGDARQIRLPDLFPPFLSREVPRHHGVLACEGSMFKSKFANALTTMMVGSLGIAAAQNGLSVGYGAEAGPMDPLVRRMVRKYCAQSFVITRNDESARLLRGLGVPTDVGTDTAWTFEPRDAGYGAAVLREHGWDGRAPVLAVCPINPYWWPVKPALGKAAARLLTGAYAASHYRSLYFHKSGATVENAYARYLGGMAEGVARFRGKRNVFPVLVAMEMLDVHACRRVAEKLGGAPVLSSRQYDMYQLVGILRACHLMVSSRYHGIVTSMPGLVASAGVTMDERIRNLLIERGHESLLLHVDDPQLADKLEVVLEKLHREQGAIQAGIGRSVVRQLQLMAHMGVALEDQVRKRFPEFPTRHGVHSWEDYLPAFGADLQRLLAVYA